MFQGVLVLGAAVVLLALFHRTLLTRFAYQFRVHDPAPSDALLLLSADERAGEWYRDGLAPQVLLIPGPAFPFADLNPLEVSRRTLIRSGIPGEAIRVLPEVDFDAGAYQQAMVLRDYVRSHRLRRLTIMTDSQATARTRWLFRKVLQREGIEIHMAAARDYGFDESDWYRCDEGLVAYFTEILAVLHDRVAYGSLCHW